MKKEQVQKKQIIKKLSQSFNKFEPNCKSNFTSFNDHQESLLNENFKLSRKVQELERQLIHDNSLGSIGRQYNNTSTNYELPSEFKQKWDNFVQDLLIDAFGDFLNQPQLLVPLIQLSITTTKEIMDQILSDKLKTILSTLNLQNTEFNVEQLTQTLTPYFRNNYKQIYSDETIDNNIFEAYQKCVENSDIFTMEQKQLINHSFGNCEEDLIKYLQALKNLTAYMSFSDPPIILESICRSTYINDSFNKEIKSQNYTLYKYYSDLFYTLDGFGKDGDCLCQVILNPPKLRGRYFAGIKPTVIILSGVEALSGQEVIDLKQRESSIYYSKDLDLREKVVLNSNNESIIYEKNETEKSEEYQIVNYEQLGRNNLFLHLDSSQSFSKSNNNNNNGLKHKFSLKENKFTKRFKLNHIKARVQKNFIELNKQIRTTPRNIQNNKSQSSFNPTLQKVPLHLLKQRSQRSQNMLKQFEESNQSSRNLKPKSRQFVNSVISQESIRNINQESSRSKFEENSIGQFNEKSVSKLTIQTPQSKSKQREPLIGNVNLETPEKVKEIRFFIYDEQKSKKRKNFFQNQNKRSVQEKFLPSRSRGDKIGYCQKILSQAKISRPATPLQIPQAQVNQDKKPGVLTNRSQSSIMKAGITSRD